MEREAFVIILDNADGATYEAVVSITMGVIKSWQHIPHVQPSIMLDEFFECENTLKNDPGFQEALRKRGITDFSLLMVDPWSAGYYGEAEECTLRLARALTWVRADPNDNGYAHPVEGLLALVDLNTMKVVKIEDNGGVPLPMQPGNYSTDHINEFRKICAPSTSPNPKAPVSRFRGTRYDGRNGASASDLPHGRVSSSIRSVTKTRVGYDR